MSNPSLAEKIKRLLPGEEFKRIRLAIMEAATAGTSAAIRIKNQVDQELRLKTGKLHDGTIVFPTDTTADLSGFVWVINYQVFQPDPVTLVVLAPDPDYSRPDYFIGLDNGTIEYREGSIDERGNSFPPEYDPTTEVLLKSVRRNSDSSNDSIDPNDQNGLIDFLENDIIPLVKDGKLKYSGIKAIRDLAGQITEFQFPTPVKGLPAINDDEFVTKSQLPSISQYGLISGGTIQATGNGLEYAASLAVVAIGEILIAQFGKKTLDPADATFGRFDVLGWEYVSPGVAEFIYIKGDAASEPGIPQVNPETQVEGRVIYVPPAATEPTGVVTEPVYLDNAEWTVSKTGAGTMDADSTDNPADGTKAVKNTLIENDYRVRFSRGSAYDLSALNDGTIGLDLSLIASMANNNLIRIVFLNASGSQASNALVLDLNKASTDYQFLALPLANFQFLTTFVQHIEIIFQMKGNGNFAGLYIDNVKIQGGVEQPPVTTPTNHNDLQNIQGGITGQRYHLNKDQWDSLEAANSPNAGNPTATMDDLAVVESDLTDLEGNVLDIEVRVDDHEARINILETQPYLEDVIAGTNVTIDKSNPKQPIINATGGGGTGSGGYTDLVGFPVIPFDKNYRHAHEMAGPVEISVNTTLVRAFPNHTVLYIKANGVDKPTFKTADNFSIQMDEWNNTAGVWNRIRLEWSPEGKPFGQVMATSGATNPGTGSTVITLTFEDNHDGSHVITGPVSLDVDDTDAAFPNRTLYYFQADGVNKPTWSAPIECNLDNYVNEAGVWNRFYLEWTPENKVTLQISNT